MKEVQCKASLKLYKNAFCHSFLFYNDHILKEFVLLIPELNYKT